MIPRSTAIKTALVVGLLCLFAFGRVSYAAHQCYRLTAGGCGGGVEQVVDGAHEQSPSQVKVCAQEMAAPDDRGTTTVLSTAALAIAPPLALAFVTAPPYEAPPAVDLGPPPARIDLLTRFGRLRL
jgi:hypothetical protein